MSTKTTIQADVGPGNKTGTYYITICNLPFGTTWQQLKDWTRSVCIVDHIEVFQDSTSGWVRVNGRENFEKAWEFINGGTFNGRSIIASDKNRKESIKIKELVDAQQTGYAHTAWYQSTPQNHIDLMTVFGLQYYMTSCPPDSGQRFTGVPIPSQGYTQQPPITTATPMAGTYAAMDPRGYYTYDEPDTQLTLAKSPAAAYPLQYQYEGARFSVPYRGRDEPIEYHHNSGFTGGEPSYRSGYVMTEPRKLHVSSFPQQARADEVKSWVCCQVDKAKIESIEIPKNSNSRYLRGYVLVILDSPSAATTAMDQLNKARFQGRKVNARFAVEGVAVGEPSVSYEETNVGWNEPKTGKPPIPTGPCRGRHNDRHKNEKSQRSKKKPPDKKSSFSKRTSQSQPDKKTSVQKSPKEKKSGSEDGPVIVDGTTHSRGKS
ncbi:hypothetical protein F66182_9159 [Fusarium sp. NRRL 66182]|nr:hypothetical protein F66182_9159 [Fusarium sp. NRRL 66182]